MLKVNIGCGNRFAENWINLDFNSTEKKVVSHNLLEPLPFKDSTVDVIYSSHLLEHFSRTQGENLLKNCYQKLKPGGILRIVVPDLENICREYISLIDNIDELENKNKYKWIIVELLDQLTRTESGGELLKLRQRIIQKNDTFLMDYAQSRTGVKLHLENNNEPQKNKARSFFSNYKTVMNKLVYLYINMVKLLLPTSIRNTVVDNTPMGEKHKWMYDKYCLSTTLKKVGFKNIIFLAAKESNIVGFNNDYLDVNPDGSCYKNSSIYCEATK